MNNVPKVIRDGKVAVLVSPGYGSGWSTWNADCEYTSALLFDPVIVEWVENGKVGEPPTDHLDPDVYTGGAHDLVICWVPVGTRFDIEEYDGYERLRVFDDSMFYTA